MPGANLVSDALLHSRTFKYTGSMQKFKVPRGVTKVDIVARGAAGGGYTVGRGGRVYAVIPVTPGEQLIVFVGGEGSMGMGGYNGGGNATYFGFGGGGASDVRQSGVKLSDRILVVGGGGGQGGNGYYYPGNGGKGGGSVGGRGGDGTYAISGKGGTGGTQGTGGTGGSGGVGPSRNGGPGADGSRGVGGAGGQSCHYNSCPGSGGGGGGGYYGGGGGGAGGGTSSTYGAGGGGGGGSSYITPSALRFNSWQGWKNATTNGLVVISWK